ncbi:hypothetical protein D9756_005784 [Leucocoprinus leucothites]|uniref:Uncharacterized protein n=1 Tax=Leucocoprinus leucothites TaxID=201217 RepID=A0A8H5D807_9AGAR|nr:hypothetical protein D9756_005784 [Leucoagaricus leucothites]
MALIENFCNDSPGKIVDTEAAYSMNLHMGYYRLDNIGTFTMTLSPLPHGGASSDVQGLEMRMLRMMTMKSWEKTELDQTLRERDDLTDLTIAHSQIDYEDRTSKCTAYIIMHANNE